jgi:hypothetical protein
MALIDSVDFVVAVLDEPTAVGNVSFEIGYAFAKNKRILVLVGRGFDEVPADLKSAFYVRAAPSDTEAVTYAARQLLAAPARQTRRYDKIADITQPIGNHANELLEKLSQDPSEEELQDLVVTAARASGAAVILGSDMLQGREPSGVDRRSNFAIWSDEIVAMSGAPLLVEIKKQLPVNGGVRALTQRLLAYLQATSSGWALVLYLHGPAAAEIGALSLPQIVFMRVEDFLTQLGTDSLATIVRRQRNLAAHGHPLH